MQLLRGRVLSVNRQNGTGVVTFNGKQHLVFYLHLCRTLVKIVDRGLVFTTERMEYTPEPGEIIVAALYRETTVGYWATQQEYRRAGQQPAQAAQ